MIFLVKYWKQFAALAVAIALFSAGWLTNGWRIHSTYQKAVIAAQEKARNVEQEWNKKLNEARDEQVKREKKLRDDAANAHAAANRLRDAINKMPICSTSTGNNSDAYGIVLNACVQRYTDVAEYADKCFSEKQTLIDAWPK